MKNGASQAGTASLAITKPATRHRKNFVAIQVKPYAWVDEGIESVLDNLQKADVNTVWAYTYDYDEGRFTRNGPIPKPDHGVYAKNRKFVGGAFYDYDPKYFRNTILKDFRSPDYGKFNVMTDVAPKAKARGMDFFCWDYNNAFPIINRSMPNYAEVSEIDVYGRRTTSACFNTPDYRAFLRDKIESYLNGYASEVDGIAWGCERMGPFNNLISGIFATKGICCFCPFCRAKGRHRGISVDRAKRGYLLLDQLVQAALKDDRPADGYFVTLWRLLVDYPEILAWEGLWTDSYDEVRGELYGMAKAIAPEKPFGFHIMQLVTLSPFWRAEEDYSKIEHYSDYLKIATYNNAGGPRLVSFLNRLSDTYFHDATPKDFLAFYYKIMNFQEAPFDQLSSKGLSPDYVAEETKRAIAGVKGKVKIYPGIDISVPTKSDQTHTTREDIRNCIQAAFAAGGEGVVLSREYVEMWIWQLTTAGETLREIFRQSGTKEN
jgi:hypothetical protein